MDLIDFVVFLVVFTVFFTASFVVLRRRRGVERETTPQRQPTLAGKLAKTRQALGESLRSVFSRSALDAAFWERLEEALVGADVGVTASQSIVGRVRDSAPEDPVAARQLLVGEVRRILAGRDRELQLVGNPAIVLVVGVNGTGKTTSIAKLASRLRATDHQPILGAADTFRAAADTQLRTWAERVGVEVVSGQQGTDPAAVAFDTLAAARARKRDVAIIDTAGRLQNKKNLMAELGKIRRVLERDGDEIGEVLLVLDATAGQNGLTQARVFTETAGVTGIVLSKLDGTARGGIVIAVEQELGVPVKFIGVGEAIDDLIPFDPDAFVDALLADV
ncbi:MAG TPA: signal recognition particle-docking protein FtsY [Acidimicrobiia bacterium]|nr:signal recognition particle-docking protein FtsY [Acidimicrobiia bacterium]